MRIFKNLVHWFSPVAVLENWSFRFFCINDE
jgi:hypothetical protein